MAEEKKAKEKLKENKPEVKRSERGKKEEVKVVEKIFTVNLKKILRCAQTRRANKAVIVLREIVSKNFRVSKKNIAISNAVNQLIWSRGIESVPLKFELKGLMEGENVRIYLKDEKIEKPKKKEEMEGKKEEKKTAEEKQKEEEDAKKLEEKKTLEKEAQAAAIKRGVQ